MDAKSLTNLLSEKHGISVRPDDPIMVLNTLHERLLDEMKENHATITLQFLEQLEGLALRWEDSSKGRAERIVNASLSAAKEAIHSAVEQACQSSAKTLEAALEKHLREQAKNTVALRSLTVLAVAGAIVSIAAAMVAVLLK